MVGTLRTPPPLLLYFNSIFISNSNKIWNLPIACIYSHINSKYFGQNRLFLPPPSPEISYFFRNLPKIFSQIHKPLKEMVHQNF